MEAVEVNGYEIEPGANLFRTDLTRAAADHQVIEGEPKTAKGRRTITVDAGLVALLRSWRAEQSRLLMRAGIRTEYLLTDSTLQA